MSESRVGWWLVLLALLVHAHSFHFHCQKSSLRCQSLALCSSMRSCRSPVGSAGTGWVVTCMPVVDSTALVGGVGSPFGYLSIGRVIASPLRLGVLLRWGAPSCVHPSGCLPWCSPQWPPSDDTYRGCGTRHFCALHRGHGCGSTTNYYSF